VSGRRSTGLLLALAVLFAGVATGLGLVLVTRDDDSPVEDVRAAAGRFGEVFNTYDYQDLDAHRDGTLDLATGSFRSEYGDAFDQGLRDVIEATKARQQAFVRDVYVSTVDEERAQAIVTIDLTHSGVTGSRTLRDVYQLYTFVEAGGRWKVDQVTDLNFDTAVDGALDASTTTSSTVPVP
jgi:hypothetical protein